MSSSTGGDVPPANHPVKPPANPTVDTSGIPGRDPCDIPPPDPQEWERQHVKRYLANNKAIYKLNQAHIDSLYDNEVDGLVFITLKWKDLCESPFNMRYGAAVKIEKLIQALGKTQGESPCSSTIFQCLTHADTSQPLRPMKVKKIRKRDRIQTQIHTAHDCRLQYTPNSSARVNQSPNSGPSS